MLMSYVVVLADFGRFSGVVGLVVLYVIYNILSKGLLLTSYINSPTITIGILVVSLESIIILLAIRKVLIDYVTRKTT